MFKTKKEPQKQLLEKNAYIVLWRMKKGEHMLMKADVNAKYRPKEMSLKWRKTNNFNCKIDGNLRNRIFWLNHECVYMYKVFVKMWNTKHKTWLKIRIIFYTNKLLKSLSCIPLYMPTKIWKNTYGLNLGLCKLSKRHMTHID